jgi:hypothetical protein
MTQLVRKVLLGAAGASLGERLEKWRARTGP